MVHSVFVETKRQGDLAMNHTEYFTVMTYSTKWKAEQVSSHLLWSDALDAVGEAIVEQQTVLFVHSTRNGISLDLTNKAIDAIHGVLA